MKTGIFKNTEVNNGREDENAVDRGGDNLSPWILVFFQGPEQVRGRNPDKGYL